MGFWVDGLLYFISVAFIFSPFQPRLTLERLGRWCLLFLLGLGWLPSFRGYQASNAFIFWVRH
jgi:hypothetical protein